MSSTDAELVARCQNELPYLTTAYEQLLRRYELQVFNTCRSYLRKTEDAEEAPQDAWLRVFHSLQKFRGEATFKSWLYKIVANVCATRYADLKTRRERIPREVEYNLQEFPATEATEFLPIGGVLGDAMDSLTVEDRQILILRHVSELTFDEIASFKLKLPC